MKQFTKRLWFSVKTALIIFLPLALITQPGEEARANPLSPVELTVVIGSTNGLSGSQVLVPVKVNQFANISVLAFALHWDPAVAAFVGVEQIGLPGLAGGNFGTTMTNDGILVVSWDDPNGLSTTLTNGATIFAVRFQLTGAPGSTSVINDDPLLREAADENLTPIPLAVMPGQVSIDQVNILPTITTQPQSITVVAGSNVTLSVVATGTLPLSYQWRLNGLDLSGATASTLSLPNIQPEQAGDYTVVLTNIAGAVTSDVARVTVNLPIDKTPPAIVITSPTSNPTFTVTNNSLNLGGTASDNVAVTQVSWSNDRGGSGAASGTTNWSVTGITLRLGVNVLTVTARDVAGNTGTDVLTVTNKPSTNVLMLTVGGTNGLPGSQVLVPIKASGFTNISLFQFSLHWNTNQLAYVSVEQFGIPMLSGGNNFWPMTNSGTVTVSWDDTGAGSQSVPDGTCIFAVRFQLIGTAGSSSSVTIDGTPTGMEAANGDMQSVAIAAASAQVIINQPIVAPTITTQPQAQTVLVGSNVTFTVVAAGTAPLSYQWRTNGVNLPGATVSTLVLTNVQQSQAGDYTVMVTNLGGAVISAVAHLTVNLPPNTPPTISAIADQNTQEDPSPAPIIAFTIGDQQTPASSLSLTGLSSNPLLIPSKNILFGGGGSNRTVTLVPVADQFGKSTITLIVSDGMASASNSFVLTVTPVNDRPTISAITDKVTIEDQPCPDIPFTVGDVETPASALTLSAASSNPGLVAVANVFFGGSGSNRTVRIVPTTNQVGTATITVTVSDGDLSASVSFLFTVLARVTAPNLVSLWRFDEGSGPAALDSAGSNIGALVNLPARTMGQLGGALRFDGIDDYVNVPDSESLYLSNKMSIVLWFKPSQVLNGASGRKDLLKKASSYCLAIDYSDADGRLAFGLNSGSSLVKSATSSWQADQWYHVAATYDGTEMLLYLNGALEGRTSATALAARTTSPLQIGGNTDQGFYLPGSIDEVRIYSAAISSNQVSNLYNGITTEPNTPPVLTPIGDKAVDELSQLMFTVSATDGDLPPQSVTYSLDAGAPNGASVHPSTGIFTWTPDETQGPSSNRVTIRVTDSGSPPLSAFETISIVVNEVNRAPTLAAIGNMTNDEGTQLSFTASATDPDVPAQTLTYSLDAGAPDGATIDPATGAFTWTPTEDQGPGNYTVTVRVTDNGSPPMSAARTVSVTVNEVNTAPMLVAIGNKTVDEGGLLAFTAAATDVDRPPQGLTYSLDKGAPTGARIDATTGVFTWIPTEEDGPNKFAVTVRVTDNGSPAMSASETITITVNEVNTAPALVTIGDKTVTEGNLLTFTASATDVDKPAQTLTYRLDAGAPNGAQIDSATGIFTWTPTEDQGPRQYTLTVRVTDNGPGLLSDSKSVTITVAELNTPPVFGVIEDKTVVEGTPLAFTVPVTDADLPAQILTFSLGAGAPDGASIDAATGAFAWTPTEEQGPSTNEITVLVSDDGPTGMSATQSFKVIVLENNSPPMLAPLDDLVAQVLIQVRITNSVTDADSPTNSNVTFDLGQGPKGLRINKYTGLIRWLPKTNDSPSTNWVTVIATDNNTNSANGPLSATNTFRVIVDDYLELSLGPAVLRTSETGSVPVNVFATAGITNLSSSLLVSNDLIKDLAIVGLTPAFGSWSLEPQGLNLWGMTFTATNGQLPPRERLVAQLTFKALDGPAPSAFAPLVVSNITAIRSNGVPVARTITNPGRVVVVGTNSLLEAVIMTNLQPALVMYGEPGSGYVLQMATEVSTEWKDAPPFTLNSLSQMIESAGGLLRPASGTNGVRLFRAYRLPK